MHDSSPVVLSVIVQRGEVRYKALVRINSKTRSVPLCEGTKLVLDDKGECNKDGTLSKSLSELLPEIRPP